MKLISSRRRSQINSEETRLLKYTVDLSQVKFQLGFLDRNHFGQR